MRIGSRVLLVGGIPIILAAAIAIAALLLLNAAERARDGAALAGTIYRNLLVETAVRDDYVDAMPVERGRHAARFAEIAASAATDLGALARNVSDPAHHAAVAAARDALDVYVARMGDLRAVSEEADRLVADMDARAGALIQLTDQARERQHDSNADIVESLAIGDRKLRGARSIVDTGNDFRMAVSELQLHLAAPLQARTDDTAGLVPVRTRLMNTARDLLGVLHTESQTSYATELEDLTRRFDDEFRRASLPAGGVAGIDGLQAIAIAMGNWAERLNKIFASEQRAQHDQIAELLTYSVQAHETEQATQNIAISTLKLGSRSSNAIDNRDPAAVARVLDESQSLSDTVAGLPISPLIQSEMIDGIDKWREGLAATGKVIDRQRSVIAAMDAASGTMISNARLLNDLLAANAQRIGELIRQILVLGAAIGLFVGAATGLVVAASITRPLRRLKQNMMDLAADPYAGQVVIADRRDELGDMARATNFFVTEIARREQALRRAKERADRALDELQKTQHDLIQAEKLASLGQLVAGVAHEINTPLGVALTTATLLGDEAGRFKGQADSPQLSRSSLTHFVDRMTEGTRLLFVNLTRAANLVHSFKQVAADQTSGERRRFDMNAWLHDLLTSLGPVLRKAGHTVTVDCRPDLAVDTYPGALAQVMTNLLMNAVTHAYGEGEAGHMSVTVSEPRPQMMRIVFADDGKGIAPENLGRVFDPFFTTGRSKGSTGLGLHIVYNLVTSSLGGRIDLDSAPGQGTRFIIDLPLVAPEESATPPRIEELQGTA